MLLNIYTTDQPTPTETKHFLYADDLAICGQGNSFEEVEEKLETVLKTQMMWTVTVEKHRIWNIFLHAETVLIDVPLKICGSPTKMEPT